MPTRLCLALAAVCLRPLVAMCAAPFVSSSDAPRDVIRPEAGSSASNGPHQAAQETEVLDIHASPSPRAGEAPQLWVEVDESLPVIGTPKRRVVDGNVYLSHEGIDLRGEAKPAKNGVGNPRAKIVRVDAEKVEEVEPPEPEQGFFFPNMSGRQR